MSAHCQILFHSSWSWFRGPRLNGGANFFSMRLVYTILFFVDTVALVVLSFLSMKMIDNGPHGWSLAGTLSGVVLSIILLVYFLRHYTKIPPDESGDRYE